MNCKYVRLFLCREGAGSGRIKSRVRHHRTFSVSGLFMIGFGSESAQMTVDYLCRVIRSIRCEYAWAICLH